MNRRAWIMACLAPVCGGAAFALEDSGKERIGMVSVTVYHGTNGNSKSAGAKALPVPVATSDRLRREERLKFKHYRLLGSDTQPLLRSYESWAEPLRPSDEVMVRFEAQGRPTRRSAVLDLELWLGRKKVLKADARLEGDRPLFMLGPEWRGGRLIIAVALAPGEKPAS